MSSLELEPTANSVVNQMRDIASIAINFAQEQIPSIEPLPFVRKAIALGGILAVSGGAVSAEATTDKATMEPHTHYRIYNLLDSRDVKLAYAKEDKLFAQCAPPGRNAYYEPLTATPSLGGHGRPPAGMRVFNKYGRMTAKLPAKGRLDGHKKFTITRFKNSRVCGAAAYVGGQNRVFFPKLKQHSGNKLTFRDPVAIQDYRHDIVTFRVFNGPK